MEHITLRVLTAPHCAHCDEFLRFFESIRGEWPNVEMQEVSMLSEEGQELVRKHLVFASPGIIINDDLFCSGNFDKTAIQEKLRSLSVI